MLKLLAREHRLRGQRRVAQQPLDLCEALLDEAAKSGSDVDVAAGEFESHGVRLAEGL